MVVIKQVENLVNACLNHTKGTLDYLSPKRDVIPSRNSQKSTYRPRDSRSAIILKIVGFLVQKPKLCIADFNSLGSILPVASVSKRLNASLSSSTSSSVSPGRSIFFLAGPLGTGFPLVAIRYIVSQRCDKINLKQLYKSQIYFLPLQIVEHHFIVGLNSNYINLQMPQIPARSNALSQPKRNLTSAWYGMDDELYFMHAQDVIVKMDSNNADNAALKDNLELYIRRAEQIEKSINEANHPPIPVDDKKIAEYKTEIAKIETAIEEEVTLIKKQDKQKIVVTTSNKNLLSYVQTQAEIYNEAVVGIQPLFRERHVFRNCPQQLPAEWLMGSDEEDHNQDKIDRIASTIKYDHESIISVKERQYKSLLQNEEQKQTVIQSIQNYYEGQKLILPGLQNNLKDNITNLETLSYRKQFLDQINLDIFKTKTSYDRKLANIIELRNIIALRHREKQNKISEMLDNSELQQPNSINQSYEEVPSPVNTKIVFPKQQPPHLWRILLLIWFAVLSLTVVWLTL